MHVFNVDETVLHVVWESFSNMREALPELFLISYTHSLYACVGLIEQREISTPRIISLYHIITPHKSVWGHRTT